MRYFVTGYSFLVSDQYGKQAIGLRPARHRPALRDSGEAGGDCEFRNLGIEGLHFSHFSAL